jgi:hypothetical protein
MNIIPTNRHFFSISSSNKKNDQLFQSLEIIRFGEANSDNNYRISNWIDQGKNYFIDAEKSNWRSAGLLYYYSFLNLAKAVIVKNSIESCDFLENRQIFHGIRQTERTNVSSINSLLDYSVTITPNNNQNGEHNIFPELYEAVTKEAWPFSQKISIQLKDIIGYCVDIATEIQDFYGIGQKTALVSSEIYNKSSHSFIIEIQIPESEFPLLSEYILECKDYAIDWETVNPNEDMSFLHKLAIKTTPKDTFMILQSNPVKFSSTNEQEILNKLHSSFVHSLKKHFEFSITERPREFWRYISYLKVNSQKITWHPLLSEYIFAFSIGTILRYYPHLLPENSKESFLANAWCCQSPNSVLRYFLLLLTEPELIYE